MHRTTPPGARSGSSSHPPYAGYRLITRAARIVVLLVAFLAAALGVSAVVAASASAAVVPATPTVGQPFSWAPDLTGLTAPVTFTIDKDLPAGLTLDGGTPAKPEIPASPAIEATADTPAVAAVEFVAGVPAIAGTGAISGTPTAACPPTTFTLTATDSATPPTVRTFSVDITIDGTLTAPAPISGTVGDPLGSSATFTPTGLKAPVSYAITNPPAWLSITDGVVSGTPDVPLTSTTFDVTATDANGAKAFGSFDIEVLDALPKQTVTGVVNVVVDYTSSLPALTVGDYEIDASFASTGLAFDAVTGVVSGTATAPIAAKAFAIVRHDTAGGPVTARGSVTVRVDAVLGANALRLSGIAGTAIAPYTPFAEANLVTAGLVAPYTFAVEPALPDGLTLDHATGVITGTPSTFLSVATYTLGVTDANGARGSGTFTASVLGRPLPSTQDITGKVGALLTSATLTAQGWTAPLRFTITPALPTGLTLNITRGSITGVPTAVLPATVYDITATDAKGNTSHAALTLTIGRGVHLAPIVSVLGGTDPGTLQVSFVKPPLAPVGQSYSVQVSDQTRQNLMTSVATTTTSSVINGLTPGATYSVVVVVNESDNFERVESLPKSGKATAALVAAKQPLAATVPAATVRVLIPQIGLVLADGAQGKGAKPLRVKAAPTRALRASPRVRIAASSFQRIVLPKVMLDGSLQVRIRVDGVWRFVGTVAATSAHQVTLPVFSVAKPGTYPVQLVPSSGRPLYIRLVVRPSAKASPAVPPAA